MEGYILAVCGAVILSALVTILLPEGKTGKFINGMLRVFCVAVMLVPLYGMFEKFGAPSLPEGGSEEVALDEGRKWRKQRHPVRLLGTQVAQNVRRKQHYAV